jgi:hypothetical protein
MNYGVCVTSDEENDYYGILQEIIEVSYYGAKSPYKTVLFRCDWFDNSPKGINVHERYKLVEVNHKRKYQKYDPFVLAHQAGQVYYATYPSTTKERDHWWATFKTKARSQIDAPIDITFFQESVVSGEIMMDVANDHDDAHEGEREEDVIDDNEEDKEEEEKGEEDEEEDGGELESFGEDDIENGREDGGEEDDIDDDVDNEDDETSDTDDSFDTDDDDTNDDVTDDEDDFS